MSRFQSYLNSAFQILGTYEGDEPFANFLRKYFSVHKNAGSTDRKLIAQLCYSYFRLGKAYTDMAMGERVLLGLFLCADSPNLILENLKPDWNLHVSSSIPEKLSFLSISDRLPVFPWVARLSSEVDEAAFNESFFTQPDLFIRIRPGKETIVRKKLDERKITYRKVSENCFAFRNNTPLDLVIEVDREAVIQDLSSQRVAEFMNMGVAPAKAWDCCAGSGGKSILLHDIFPELKLTVSDERKSILINLVKRFRSAAVNHYNAFQADLNKPLQNKELGSFPLIMVDVPCTGSGTWSRNPEQLYFFNEKQIPVYSSRQKAILGHVVPFLEVEGHLLYITCSVFREENEEIVDFLVGKHSLRLIKMGLLKGYRDKADTLFAALLQKF